MNWIRKKKKDNKLYLETKENALSVIESTLLSKEQIKHLKSKENIWKYMECKENKEKLRK
ncbi:hypothetical protein CWI38_0205p0010 [Hamiltosporidium tvaerminnensis]|uniref:Uncharacterized protein n=1 Tax=Hamiltosporidium tvaerminnensis TaxID=1176355 RepID=A0A4Q9M2L7_9MICR|nr:hypothetical protein CWI38_0205p0010 [Hamiltosporidium tvaerminnensis]